MSTISNSTNRVSGLLSGLDTEELVKAMTANTKNRINSKKQKLQSLEWKQESYRTVIDKIAEFKDKYLDITKSTSIKANAVMRKCKAESSNDKIISATATGGATPAKYTIAEASSAKTASITSEGRAADGAIKLDFSYAVSGRTYDVKVNLDGAEKTIAFKAGTSAEQTKENFLKAANLAFEGSIHGDQGFEIDGDGWLKFNGDGDGVYHTFNVGANGAVGLANPASSKISTTATLGSIGFNQKLESDDGVYSININGKIFKFSNDTKVSDMMDTINNSGAGVKISFSNVSQSFTLETKDSGSGQEINLYQTSGNLLNALFNISDDKLGISKADSAQIEYVINDTYTGEVREGIKNWLKEGFDPHNQVDSKLELFIKVDGVDKKLNLDMSALVKADGKTYSGDEIDTVLKNAFQQEYGSTDIQIAYDNGKISLTSSAHKIEMSTNEFGLKEGETNERTVKGDKAFLIAEGVSSMEFDVGGSKVVVTAEGSDGMKINDLVNAGLFTIRKDGTLVANAALTASDKAAKDMLNKYFGKETLVPATANDTYTAYGSNAKLVLSTDGVNFTTYTSNTSEFTFDGTTINVTALKDFKADSESDYITVETSKDTSALKELVTGFVEDYNTLLSDLYEITSTSRPKSAGDYYDPLTEEQEDEMDEKEIEKWNENAKKGLLYRDSNVSRFLSELRGAMSTYIEGFGLQDMGVKLTKYWEDNGKLEVDESKLESALETYSDQIADLFTSKNGLAAKIENVMDRAISTKTDKYGYLTALAGQKGTKTDTDNQIYKQIESIKDIIEKLEEKYENEQERYWSKFTALEKYMAQMQSQSSYFTTE